MRQKLKKLLPVVLLGFMPSLLIAIDDGPRMYWNAPVDLTIVQTQAWSIHGNQLQPYCKCSRSVSDTNGYNNSWKYCR